MKIWQLNWYTRTETVTTVTLRLRFVICKENYDYCNYFSKNFDIRVNGTVFYKVVEIWTKYYLKTENDNKITVLNLNLQLGLEKYFSNMMER